MVVKDKEKDAQLARIWLCHTVTNGGSLVNVKPVTKTYAKPTGLPVPMHITKHNTLQGMKSRLELTTK